MLSGDILLIQYVRYHYSRFCLCSFKCNLAAGYGHFHGKVYLFFDFTKGTNNLGSTVCKLTAYPHYINRKHNPVATTLPTKSYL